ncbi:MAG: GNAT family N-acetyltransferase [Anaerolineales bacterium]
MSSITIPNRTEHPANLRPLSIFRDLPSVADLIEICFSSTMDNDGRRYVQDMRRAGSDNSFIQWANRAAESTSLPLTGFVWEENNKIIGNVSLVPFHHNKQRIYLIANVAVHPDHRRKGIARILTEYAANQAREKKADSIWLHVRDDNPGAIDLYTKLGFVERARRTTWQASTDAHATSLNADINITNRQPNDWNLQLTWLKRLYPDALAWHRNWNFKPLKPGFWNWLYSFLMDTNARQWAAQKDSALQAVASWIPYGRGEFLFVATAENSDPQALTALLFKARRDLFYSHPNLILEFPTGEFDKAIEAGGFHPLRTLIWMQATS